MLFCSFAKLYMIRLQFELKSIFHTHSSVHYLECFVTDFTKWSISTQTRKFAISREEISVKNQKIYDSKKAYCY